MLRTEREIQHDIEILQALNAKGRVKAEAMSDTHLQWRIARDGFKPCFISLTTGTVTQAGRRAPAVGLKEALALMGIAL